MKHPTSYQIATNYQLWIEYVDPVGNGTEEEFNAWTVEEKIQIQKECWPEDTLPIDDCDCENCQEARGLK